MEDLPSRLSATLNVLLSLRQMTKTTLAKRAGMPTSQVSKYLKGKKLPQLPQLVRLARALEVDLLTVFFAESRVQDVQRRMAARNDPGELADQAGDIFLLREGGLLIKHPLSDVADAMNRLGHHIQDLQLALAICRERQKQP